MVRFDYDTKLPEGREACFQVALLYTNRFGERRLRVHSLSLRTANGLPDIFRGADMDALLCALPKMQVSEVAKTPLGQLRGKMTAKVGDCVEKDVSKTLTVLSHVLHSSVHLLDFSHQTVGILACYRKHCTSTSTSSGQLILPEGLKLLPVYMNCVLRSDAFRKGGMNVGWQ